MKKAHELVHYRCCRIIRLSPRDGFTTYSALSPAIGLFVTVPAQCEALSRVNASVEASRPHGFVVRVGAFVSCTSRVHRVPHPTFVTIAKRPLIGRGTGGKVPVICPSSQAKAAATNWHDRQISLGA
jgi:hypothetical protein